MRASVGAGVLRALAGAVLRLYPRAWRERYGEEVADLVAARQVRPRTLADLAAGAGDAWLHRRRIPGARSPRNRRVSGARSPRNGPVSGARSPRNGPVSGARSPRQRVPGARLPHRPGLPGVRPLRLPLVAVLVVGVYGLWLLWSPGVRDLASLRGVWAEAARAGSFAGDLRGTATALFASAAAMALLSTAQLGLAVRAAAKHAPLGAAARTTGRRVVVTGLVVALPIALVLTMYVGLMLNTAPTMDAYPLMDAGPLADVARALDADPPLGPLGGAITGGFFVPALMALILPLPLVAATSSALRPAARAAAKSLMVAAIANGIAWLAVAALVTMGLMEASPWFVTALGAGAVLSVGMASLVARTALRRAPEDPIMPPDRAHLGRALI